MLCQKPKSMFYFQGKTLRRVKWSQWGYSFAGDGKTLRGAFWQIELLNCNSLYHGKNSEK